ncbi:hypothetical protein FMN50_22790 [Rhodobacterales bacterium]|nr:hypothetical protein FMN50_22790 [Rhodobacterales bacterium]
MGLISLSACETVDARLQASVEQAALTEATKHFPQYPADCRRKERSGVRNGDPLDVALIRTDNALGRQNDRIRRCSGWYDELKAGFKGE